MTRTYAAILHGDRLEWTGDAPSSPEIGRAIPVTVVVEDPPPRPGGEDPEAWSRAVDAMRRLAARGTFAQITDPVAWQREARKDRPLPGRDDERPSSTTR